MENIELVQQASNAPVLWLLASITIMISVLQAVLFVRKSNEMTKKAELDPALPKQAFRIGLITAIGPALGVFIVMVGLMASIGGPIAWLRLSIIGAAATELSAATIGAQAAGVELGSPQFGMTALAVSWFVMALNGAGWLLFTGVATPSLEKLRTKVSGGDNKWLAIISGACSLGIFGYLNSGDILKGVPNAVSVLIGAVSMIILVRIVCKKIPKLMEYSLGIAMIIGIFAAILVNGIA